MTSPRPDSLSPLPTSRLPGLLLLAGVVALAYALAWGAGWQAHGFSPLVLAIFLGALLGNLFPALTGPRCRPGLVLAQRQGLRLGVALFGFGLSVADLRSVGGVGLGVDLFMVASTLILGYSLGTRWLGMTPAAAWLVAAGNAICGAAAVVAVAPVVLGGHGNAGARSVAQGSEPAGAADHEVTHTVSAVATVVLFGSLAMLLYPLLYALLPGMKSAFGLYVGATVQEVAQVVAIGQGLGEGVAGPAVIGKMIRVLLLVPVLLGLSWWQGRSVEGQPGFSWQSVPWFALGFLACLGVNSLALLPPGPTAWLKALGTLLLTAAMGALGLDTTWARMRRAGGKPLVLGGVLFAYLVFVGGLVSAWAAGAGGV